MKFIFVSDIHGSLFYAQKGVEAFQQEQGDQLILLGDELYHGPRNPLPKEYDPGAVAQCLNEYKEKVIAVRGNCDAEVDQMLLEFPMLADYAILYSGTRRVFVTHGHLFDENNLPPLSKGDVLIHGHTHLPVAKKQGDIFIVNPGSVALPKEGHPHTYGVMENDTFYIKTFVGEVYKKIQFL